MTHEAPAPPAPETHSFQAEISQLLDLVIHSLYTNRDIFLRELVSNAADALERFRHETLVNPAVPGRGDELAIRLAVDADAKRIVVSDNGDGMTRDQLAENLGTIARSGTKEYLARLAEAAKADANFIGQFGVGFYSAFMVAKRVTVETRSFHSDSPGWRWESDGGGQYTIAPAEGLERGTRITLDLKDEAEEFASDSRVREVVRRFNSFVSFPILLGDERLNTVQAVWARSRGEVAKEEYDEFYKFQSGDPQEPRFVFHFNADAPLAINALLFVPRDNFERHGLGRAKPGVDLHCRKVMIMKGPEELLPEWMRFVRGVVDSDDLDLNISREHLQDSRVVRKLSQVITGRFLKFLAEQADKDPDAYAEFHDHFALFLKEGATQDFAHRAELAKLLRFETSSLEPGKKASFADYASRMRDGQTAIYHINGPSREAIEAGPYVEAFKARGIEVVYTYEQIDDFVLSHLGEFDGKRFVSADQEDLELPGDPVDAPGEPLADEAMKSLCEWMKEALGGAVREVKPSARLVESPAAATTMAGMTAGMHRLMAAMSKESGAAPAFAALELNPRSPLVKRIDALRAEDGEFAKDLAGQLLDNALLAAGLLSDPKRMVERMNKLLARAAGA